MKSKNSLDAAIRERLGATRAFRHGCLFLVACVLLLPVVGLCGAASLGDPDGAATMCALLPFMGMTGPLFKDTDGNADGGDDPLYKSIMAKIAENRKAMEEIEKTIGEHAETKKEVEELHKAIKGFDGMSGDVKTVFEKVAKMEAKLANVRREVSGDPLKRITEDEEMRSIVTSHAKAAYLRNHNKEVPKEIVEAGRKMTDIVNGKALTGGATPGSALINQELVKAIYQLVATYGRWADFDVLRPGTRTVKIPVDTTDPTAVWATEGVAPSEGSYAGTQVTLTIRKILVWIGVSNDLLEDDEVGLASHLSTKFARAVAKRLDHACFVADGTDDATHGDYEGIFVGGTAYGLPTGIDTIEELTLAHFTGLVAGADEALCESTNSKWWGHGQVLVELLNVKDANGRPIFLTALEAPAAGGIGSILGYPFIKTNLAPKVVGASLPILAFGDPMGLAVAVRSDFEVASSDQVRFTEDQTVFRGRMRAGTKIKQATAFEVMTFGAAV